MLKKAFLLLKKNSRRQAYVVRNDKDNLILHADLYATERSRVASKMIGSPPAAALNGAPGGAGAPAPEQDPASRRPRPAELLGRFALLWCVGWFERSFMLGEVCNFIAAVLSTIGAAFCCVAMLLLEPNFVNLLAALGAGLGILGGVAWIVAAIVAIRQKLPPDAIMLFSPILPKVARAFGTWR